MIYLDYAATGIVYPEVLSLDAQAEREFYANPSSLHEAGFHANKALEQAREHILKRFNLQKTHQLLFTSGATEANNLFLKGAAFSYSNRGKRILISSTEHPSVDNCAKALSSSGFEVIRLPVDSNGKVQPASLEGMMDDQVILVSIIGINNETGAINDLDALSKIVHRYPKAFFHSDLTQLIGKHDIDFSILDAFSFSAHKFGGRKGVGGLVLNKRIKLHPLFNGGDQEFGLRPGTNNVVGAMTMDLALSLSYEHMKECLEKVKGIRDYLLLKLENYPEFISINSPIDASPYILNFSFLKHKASVIVEALSLKGIYVSSVSACSSKKEPISNILLAMGKEKRIAENSMRLSFGKDTAKEDIDAFLSALEENLKELFRL